jgi:hypothetical protein
VNSRSATCSAESAGMPRTKDWSARRSIARYSSPTPPRSEGTCSCAPRTSCPLCRHGGSRPKRCTRSTVWFGIRGRRVFKGMSSRYSPNSSAGYKLRQPQVPLPRQIPPAFMGVFSAYLGLPIARIRRADARLKQRKVRKTICRFFVRTLTSPDKW